MESSGLSHRSKAYQFASEKTPESSSFFCDFLRENMNGAISIDNRGDTVLHLLAIHGNVDVMESLVLTNELLMKKNMNGNTALHEAARFGQAGVAKIMLRKKQYLVMEQNESRETPLYLAAAYGKREVFQVLESFGSDCLTRRRDGRTILHAAVEGERYCHPETTPCDGPQKVTDAASQVKYLETELGRSKASLEIANADN
ncbi:E3 ubiquitin-protein ligase MIB2-like [Camellia sinensis]|uniref:E3 ubiquitin-protein ligase MIB2-like n=1 Tax=Camellia sinensis TaxID=4442 RepID=UPI0010368402|nr:E3 ubiquitin-protein ligase MIB2-like [Camellia sinensis]